MLALAKAPTVDGQRDQAFLGADRRIGGLNAGAEKQLLLAKIVLSGVPVDEEQAGGWLLQAVGDEQQNGNGFDAVEIENPALESVAGMLFCADEARRSGLVVPGQVTEEGPERFAAALLKGGEIAAGIEGSGSVVGAEGAAGGGGGGGGEELAARDG